MVFEVFGRETESSPSGIHDTVRQLDELKKRMVNIVNMTDKETKFDEVVIHEEDDSTTVSAETFLKMGKRKLLEQKDALIRADKAAENRDKSVLQEFLKSSTRSKHFFLENRRDALPWLSRYESIRSTMKNTRLENTAS